MFEKIKMNDFGLLICANSSSITLDDINPYELLALTKTYKFVLLRKFKKYDQHQLLNYSKRLGQLLAWKFGEVMELKVHEQPKNYLFTNEKVPLHWDGAFHQEPQYLFFHCLNAPLAEAGGETIFVDTERVWKNASVSQRKKWQALSLRYSTEKLAHYGGTIDSALVQQHPFTQHPILRFAEPVYTESNPVSVEVLGETPELSANIICELTDLCYRHTYEHVWQENDYLIADNFSLIHGRHAFKQFSPRHLRRIQILKEHQQ